MIPAKAKRDEWRKLAMETVMISAVGEYTPEEFLVLLDAVDELEQQVLQLQKALKASCQIGEQCDNKRGAS